MAARLMVLRINRVMSCYTTTIAFYDGRTYLAPTSAHVAHKYSTVRTINYKETTMEPSLNHVDKDYLEKDLDGLLNTIFSEQYRNNTDTKAVESKKVYVAHNYMVRKLKNVFSLVMEKEDESSTKLLHKILEAILMTKGNITATQLERVLCIGTKCNGEQHLALNAAFLAILGCREIMTDEAVRHIYNIMQHIRTSQEPAEHLEAINIYYAVIKQHPYLLHQLAQHHRSYLEYIREMAQFVRLKVPHEDDITQVKDLRKILDFLRVDHYAAITGHIYLPIVINRTNMAIDILTKRDMCYESEECTPQTTIKQHILKDMGWKVQYITQKEYDSLQTDMQKEEYISKVLAYMYMDAQFIERPKWVEPYPRQ